MARRPAQPRSKEQLAASAKRARAVAKKKVRGPLQKRIAELERRLGAPSRSPVRELGWAESTKRVTRQHLALDNPNFAEVDSRYRNLTHPSSPHHVSSIFNFGIQAKAAGSFFGEILIASLLNVQIAE